MDAEGKSLVMTAQITPCEQHDNLLIDFLQIIFKIFDNSFVLGL
jgi:hypothetical protein